MTAAAVNAAFPVAIAVAIGIPLMRARNVRNYFFIALLLTMGALIFAVHLALQGRFELSPRLGLYLALDVVLFIMAVMGGRVIPMFTNNGVPGAGASRHALVEKFALGTVILLFAADLIAIAADRHRRDCADRRAGAWRASVPLETVAHPRYAARVDTACGIRMDSRRTSRCAACRHWICWPHRMRSMRSRWARSAD